MSDADVAAELAAWGIDVATVTELAIDDDSALVIYHKDGKPWGLVIEQDREGLQRIARYLADRGIPVDRGAILG